MVVPPVDHDCVLKDVVVEQANRIAKLERDLEQLKKSLIGPKSERRKMPRPTEGTKATAEEKLATRRERAALRSEVQTLRIEHKVPAKQRVCPSCGNDKLKPIGNGKMTIVWEFVPASFVRHEHVQEVLRCKCAEYVVTAPGAPKLFEKGRYGASFVAHLVVAKCADHLPIYRIEKDFKRQGIPMARSTMNALLHRAGELTSPLWQRILEKVRGRAIVMADETRMRVIRGVDDKPRNGFVWTFVAEDDERGLDVALVFAADRSSELPKRVLEGTSGYLVSDAYAGYNVIADVSTRKRAGCHAHLRRYFHECLTKEPSAQQPIDIIGELYRVEDEAKARGIIGTRSHFELRNQKSAPIRDRLKAWLDENLKVHPPRSQLGIAIKYGLKQWTELGRFLEDPRIPLDNNASERALRRVALGRKNYLFVGDVDAGTNIAGLYTLIATCEARGINPFAYLTDVLARVQDHPQSRLDELLPGAWAAAQA